MYSTLAPWQAVHQIGTRNPATTNTGIIDDYRVEEIENKLTQHFRYLDKLVDELVKGRKMETTLHIA
ncbi:DUF2200 family protein [uncultured Sunxiuqinia sp.]|uniref:DUF2200 family protein n=1 Tax=uncultured Sunxiuqinia sp. TaxID=1573825 RepID=UPI00198B90F1|nr:DUF2200 family protein [Sunxiuqinia sp.]